MENLKEYKNKLIGIRNLIIKSLEKAESKEEIHRYAISLHNVNEKIKIVEKKIGRINPVIIIFMSASLPVLRLNMDMNKTAKRNDNWNEPEIFVLAIKKQTIKIYVIGCNPRKKL